MWARSSRFSSLSSTRRTRGADGRRPILTASIRRRNSRVVSARSIWAFAFWTGPDRSSCARRTASATLSAETRSSRAVDSMASAAARRASTRALRAAATSSRSALREAPSTRTTEAPPPGRAAATTCTGRGGPSSGRSCSSNSVDRRSFGRPRRLPGERVERLTEARREDVRARHFHPLEDLDPPAGPLRETPADGLDPPLAVEAEEGDRRLVEKAGLPLVPAAGTGLDEDDGHLDRLSVPDHRQERPRDVDAPAEFVRDRVRRPGRARPLVKTASTSCRNALSSSAGTMLPAEGSPSISRAGRPKSFAAPEFQYVILPLRSTAQTATVSAASSAGPKATRTAGAAFEPAHQSSTRDPRKSFLAPVAMEDIQFRMRLADTSAILASRGRDRERRTG